MDKVQRCVLLCLVATNSIAYPEDRDILPFTHWHCSVIFPLRLPPVMHLRGGSLAVFEQATDFNQTLGKPPVLDEPVASLTDESGITLKYRRNSFSTVETRAVGQLSTKGDVNSTGKLIVNAPTTQVEKQRRRAPPSPRGSGSEFQNDLPVSTVIKRSQNSTRKLQPRRWRQHPLKKGQAKELSAKIPKQARQTKAWRKLLEELMIFRQMHGHCRPSSG
jgi:hypothetical protein